MNHLLLPVRYPEKQRELPIGRRRFGSAVSSFRLIHAVDLKPVITAVIGAAVFSAFHYIGPFGDPLQLPSFLFRCIAGLMLTGLYLGRGYGITAYTHSFYDLWITFGVI